MHISEILSAKLRSLKIGSSEKKDKIAPLLDVEATTAHHTAMNTLISRMLQGEDVFQNYMKVIMASDTRDARLKAKINYFLYVHGSKPGVLDLTVNTLLKDFTDPIIELRLLATSFVGRIPYVDEYFLRQLVHLLQTGSKRETREVCLALPRFFRRPEWVQKYKLQSVLRQHCLSPDGTAGIQAAIQVFNEARILDLDEVLRLLEYSRGSRERKILLLELLRIHIRAGEIHQDKMKAQATNLLLRLIKGFDSLLAVSAAKILLTLDKSHVQRIYDSLLTFYKCANGRKKLIILKAIENIVCDGSNNRLQYLNSDFIFASNDSRKISKIKLNILVRSPDKYTIKEVNSLGKMKKLPFETFLAKVALNIPDSDLYESCCSKNLMLTLKIICIVPFVSQDWAAIINQHISKIDRIKSNRSQIIRTLRRTVDTISAFEMVEPVCRKMFAEAPRKSVELFECLIKWYSMDIIDTESLLMYAENSFLAKCLLTKLLKEKKETLQRKFEVNERDSLIRRYERLPYKSKQNFTNNEKCKYFIKNLILEFPTIFNNAVRSTSPNNFQALGGGDVNNIRNMIPSPVERVLKSFEHQNFKLKITVYENRLYGAIYDVGRPVRVSVRCLNILQTVDQHLKFDICELNAQFEFINLQMTVGTEQLNLNMSLLDLIEPYQCSVSYFNQKFEDYRFYNILNDKIIQCGLQRIDDNMFAFKILESEFLAILISNQLVVKSDNENLLTSLVRIFEGRDTQKPIIIH